MSTARAGKIFGNTIKVLTASSSFSELTNKKIKNDELIWSHEFAANKTAFALSFGLCGFAYGGVSLLLFSTSAPINLAFVAAPLLNLIKLQEVR